MFSIVIFVASFQINRLFLFRDVAHLLSERTPPNVVKFQDRGIFKGEIVSTNIPDYCVVCFKSSKLHYFPVDDSGQFRRCLWDDEVSDDDKKDIVMTMIQWLQKHANKDYTANMIQSKDRLLFDEVFESLKRID